MSTRAIRQLSPAQAPDGALLVVEDPPGGLHIGGMLGNFPSVGGASPLWLCVESRGPGAVRVCVGSEPILEFTRGAVKQLGGMSFDRNAAEGLLMTARLFPTEPSGLAWHVASALLDIAQAIERHGAGGAVWILLAGRFLDGDLAGLGNPVGMSPDAWEPFREVWERRTLTIRLLNPGCDQGHEFLQAAAQEWDRLRMNSIAESISSLANVDGAIVTNGSPEVLAFGVICNRFSCPATEVRDPKGEVINASKFGGSRHRSAIDFCSTYSPAGALVASHDGGLTVFASMDQGQVVGNQVSLISSDSEVQPT